MAIRIEHVGDVAIVIAEDKFDYSSDYRKLDDTLSTLMDDHQKILLNMSRMKFFYPTTAISNMIRVHKMAAEREVTLYFCGVEPRIDGPIKSYPAKLPYTYFSTCEEALKALQEV